MAALSDHDRRDAEHAARAETAILVQKYVRRVLDLTKAYIKEALDDAAREGIAIDGTAIGRSAAERAASHYFGIEPSAVKEIVEGEAHRA